MEAGVVNVLLTIDPVASHASGQYLTWDGMPFDGDQTARCDAATPHELWAWTVTADEAPGAAAGPRADVRRLTTIVAGSAGQVPEAFNEAVLAHFAGSPAREVLGPGAGDGAAGDATGQDFVSRVAPPAPATTIEDSSPVGVAETSSSSPISKNPGPAGEAVSGTSAPDAVSGPLRLRSVQS